MSDDLPSSLPRSSAAKHPLSLRRLAIFSGRLSIVAIVLATSMVACRIPGKSIASNYKNVDQFNFDVAAGPKNYHIEGYLTRSTELGKRPDGYPGRVREHTRLRQFFRTEPLRRTAVGAGVAQGAGHSGRPYRRRFYPARGVGTRAWRGSRRTADGLRLASARADS